MKNTQYANNYVKPSSDSRKISVIIFFLAIITFFTSLLAVKVLQKTNLIKAFSSKASATSQVNIDLSEDLENADYIPLFLQTDERWGSLDYGDDCIATSGCGPTCLSMVRCGLGNDGKWNPYKVARIVEENGYYKTGYGTSWDCMREGAELIGLEYHEVIFDEEHIINELRSGTPIICSMSPGDFTTTGHYIVLTGVTDDDRIILNDPNSNENSFKYWDIDVIMSQVKNLWGYSLAENS